MSAIEKKLGLGNGTIGKWGKNGRVPNYANLCAVAEALGVTVSELTGAEDIKKSPAVSGEGMSELGRELYSIWETADDDERRLLLDMAKMLKNRRNPN